MTDPAEVSRLSRKIALHMEPEPTCLPNDPENFHMLYPSMPSPENWWIWKVDIRPHGKSTYAWHPRSITDAEVFVMLLKWLLEREYVLVQIGTEFLACFPSDMQVMGYHRWATHKTPEIAVALAVERVIDAEVK